MSARLPGQPARPFTRSAVAVTALSALVLAGCSANSEGEQNDDANASSDSEKVSVVTTTNVYSDLVSQVGGDTVEVTPVIDSAAQDPHSYEASPQDRLTIEQADMVVLNGGGYDAFMDDMSTDSQQVVNAVEVSGLQSEEEAAEQHEHDHGHEEGGHAEEGHEEGDHAEGGHEEGDHAEEGHGEDGHEEGGHEEGGHEGHHHHHGGFNEHVWYDLDSVMKLTDQVAEQLGEIDQENSEQYTDNAKSLNEKLSDLKTEVDGIDAGGGYVATEPLAGYLLEDAGLHDDTPQEFMTAIDSQTDVAPAVMKETTDLVESGHIDLLAFNLQTSTGQTEQLRETAEESDVDVVEFSETLPGGEGYVEWMEDNINRVSQAVKS